MVNLEEKTTQLKAVRHQIDQLEQAHKAAVSGLKEDKKQLEEEILAAMKEVGTKTIRNDAGTFSATTQRGVNFRDESAALAWAKENDLVTMDRRSVVQKLKQDYGDELPDFAEAVERTTLAVKA